MSRINEGKGPLTRVDLDYDVCDDCGGSCNDNMKLSHSSCPGKPVCLTYHKSSGLLSVTCSQCHELIGAISVAPGGAS